MCVYICAWLGKQTAWPLNVVLSDHKILKLFIFQPEIAY